MQSAIYLPNFDLFGDARLLAEFAAESGTDISPVTKGFMDKLRDFFD